MLPFNPPWKYQKNFGFLMFSGSIEREIAVKFVKQIALKYYSHYYGRVCVEYQFKSTDKDRKIKKNLLAFLATSQCCMEKKYCLLIFLTHWVVLKKHWTNTLNFEFIERHI